MHSRRRARQVALQILFQMEASSLTAVQAIPLYWQSLHQSDVEGGQTGNEEGFAEKLVQGYAANQESVDKNIREASEHWRLERMPAVDKNILRLGVYELLYCSDIPVRVVLNEAVELAKRYGSEDSPAFVNGILDKVARTVRSES